MTGDLFDFNVDGDHGVIDLSKMKDMLMKQDVMDDSDFDDFNDFEDFDFYDDY